MVLLGNDCAVAKPMRLLASGRCDTASLCLGLVCSRSRETSGKWMVALIDRPLTISTVRQLSAFAFSAILMAAGCGRRDIELITVAGRVTLDGKPPPGPGHHRLRAAGSVGRPAAAPRDGKASAAMAASRPIVRPRRRVRARPLSSADRLLESAPDHRRAPAAVSFIPARYMSYANSRLELVVEPGTSQIEWNAELTSP